MKKIDQILAFAMEKRASDIHFSAEEPVRFRIDGDLVGLQDSHTSPDEVKKIVFEILSPEEREKLLKEKNLDKSYYVPSIGQFRVNVFMNRKGIAAVLRTIPVKIPSMEDLRLPEVIRKIADKPKGLILVTGPTGSGKSTTLAAIIDYINTTFPGHILTVEDPIEFVHQSKKSLVNQRDIGHSCNTFQDALKYALREDPDVILIGELRDLETISLALTAAETGHLVFGTLHTR
ncbi:MAG: PilT/PilU family type 4a pilus ATPase, partial [Proteobacteria bacterium]|nr:PilT/PilU family type 4a pilus ATPase [Pseudomonadota bacterium]